MGSQKGGVKWHASGDQKAVDHERHSVCLAEGGQRGNVRVAYIAPYQGPDLLATRPMLRNLGLAANVKMELVSELLNSAGSEVEIVSQGEVVDRHWKFFPGFGEPNPMCSMVPAFYASALPIKVINVPWSAFRTLRLFQRRHKVSPFDVVLLYNLKLPQVICGLYAIRRGLPVVLEYEDDALVDLAGRSEGGLIEALYVRLAKKLLNSTAACVGVSPYLLTQVPASVPKVLLRGVVGKDIIKIGTESTIGRKNWIVFSGTFSVAKGLVPLVKAWDLINLPDWELHIAGHGQKADLLRELAQHNKSIVFHGLLSREENVQLLRAAAIGINPHDLSETPGNVFAFKIIEYLAAGTHVITTPMGVLEPELEAGITYMPDNSPETIAATIRQVVTVGEYKRTAAAAARQMYGPEAVAESLSALLNQAITGTV